MSNIKERAVWLLVLVLVATNGVLAYYLFSKVRYRHAARATEIAEVSLPSDVKDRITILFTGNTWSTLEPVGSPCVRPRGGVTRRATIIKEERGKNSDFLLIDAGGLFGGGNVLDRLRPTINLRMLELMGYDAVNIAPSELSFGHTYLEEQMKISGFPFLSANLIYKDSQRAFAKPYIIKDTGKFKVAILGVTSELKHVPSETKEFLEVLDPVATIDKYVRELKPKTDFIVLLSSLELDTLQLLLEAVPDIDLVVSTMSLIPKMPRKRFGRSALRKPREKIGNTYLHSAITTSGGTAILKVELGRGKDGKLYRGYKIIEIKLNVPEHPDVARALQNLYNRVEEIHQTLWHR